MQHINILDENNMIIAQTQRKYFQFFHEKTLKNIRVEGMYLYIIKTVYVRAIADIVLNVEKFL